MKIDINTFQQYLEQAKTFVLSGAGPDSAKYIKLSHRDNVFSIVSTNLITSMTLVLDNESIEADTDFDVLLNYDRLKPFIANLKGDVTIQPKGKKAVLKSGSRRSTLSTYDVSFYPTIKTSLDNLIFDFEIPTDIFLEAITRTAFVGASSGVASPTSKGRLYLDIIDSTATFVATDGNSMSALSVELSGTHAGAILLPAKEVLSVAAVIQKVCYDETVRISSNGDVLLIEFSNATISIVALGNKFVQYKSFLDIADKDFYVDLQVDVREMANVLTYMESSNIYVKLAINALTGKIELSNNEEQTGDQSLDIVSSIAHTIENDFEINVSSLYLLNFFKALLKSKAKTATLYMTDYDEPIYIVDDQNTAGTILLAPTLAN